MLYFILRASGKCIQKSPYYCDWFGNNKVCRKFSFVQKDLNSVMYDLTVSIIKIKKIY